MDKTYMHLYDKLYQTFLGFCLYGGKYKENIDNMFNDCKSTEDNDLIILHTIVLSATQLETANFINKESVDTKFSSLSDNESCYFLCHILELVYTYIFPDRIILQVIKEKLETYKNDGKLIYHLFKKNLPLLHITNHISSQDTMEDEYKSKADHQEFKLKNRSFISVQKGFSSSSPFFYSALQDRFSHSQIRGGGFYVRWHDVGIAIDPGYNFMGNMHKSGFHILDINYVIITHNHIDHNADLSIIDDLVAQTSRTKIDVYCDKDTYNANIRNFNMLNMHICEPEQNKHARINLGDERNIQFEITATQHIFDSIEKANENTFGLKLHLNNYDNTNCIIGFTSDTKYEPDLVDFFKDCNYVIANISETNDKDFFRNEGKCNHLGYTGCKNLITGCTSGENKPIFLISEFWAGKSDIRLSLIHCLRKECNYKKIIPADVGMMFYIDNNSFKCSYCGQECGIDEMHILNPKIPYSDISLICDTCML